MSDNSRHHELDLRLRNTPRRSRLLIADDNRALAENLAEIFAADGHTCVVVDDAEVAIAHLESSRFDLLLTDLHMPPRDGICVVAAARRRSSCMPILLFTAATGSRECRAARHAGVTEVFAKPGELRLLVDTVGRQLLRGRVIHGAGEAPSPRGDRTSRGSGDRR